MRTTAPGVTLRSAAACDATAISGLHAKRFARGWTAREIADLLGDPVVFAIIAETARGIVGFIMARTVAGEAEILTLATCERHLRRGIAAELLARARIVAAEHGARAMFLEVAADNLPALSLYARGGFIEKARRGNYYGAGPQGDALVLACQLKAPVDAGAADS